MYSSPSFAAFLTTLGLLVLPGTCVRGEDSGGIPSFPGTTNRDSKEFVTRVGTSILKAARTRPVKIALEKYAYTTPRVGRHELSIRMRWAGALTRKKFTADIKVLIDSTDRVRWEVLNIDYKDSNPSPIPHSTRKVQELIRVLNRESP